MRSVGRVGLLTALWLLAWGDASLANALSGAVLATGLLLAFPPPAARSSRGRVNLRAVARLAGYVVVQLWTSNVVMTREVLRRTSTAHPGILAHRLRHPSEHVVTVMTSVIALSPGTMTVDVDRTSSTIYVHFLFLREVSAARATLERLERLASDAIDPDPSTNGAAVT
jgi:multicomponent Na+:H+ antiporter subunit E